MNSGLEQIEATAEDAEAKARVRRDVMNGGSRRRSRWSSSNDLDADEDSWNYYRRVGFDDDYGNKGEIYYFGQWTSSGQRSIDLSIYSGMINW